MCYSAVCSTQPLVFNRPKIRLQSTDVTSSNFCEIIHWDISFLISYLPYQRDSYPSGGDDNGSGSVPPATFFVVDETEKSRKSKKNNG